MTKFCLVKSYVFKIQRFERSLKTVCLMIEILRLPILVYLGLYRYEFITLRVLHIWQRATFPFIDLK